MHDITNSVTNSIMYDIQVIYFFTLLKGGIWKWKNRTYSLKTDFHLSLMTFLNICRKFAFPRTYNAGGSLALGGSKCETGSEVSLFSRMGVEAGAQQ